MRHRSRDLGADFTTPAIDLDALVTPRSEPPPLLDVKLAEIIDFLVEAGERLALERNQYLQEALERVAATNPLPRRVVENLYTGRAPFIDARGAVAAVSMPTSPIRRLSRWLGLTHGSTAASTAPFAPFRRA